MLMYDISATQHFDLGIKLCNVSRYFGALTDSIKLSISKCITSVIFIVKQMHKGVSC